MTHSLCESDLCLRQKAAPEITGRLFAILYDVAKTSRSTETACGQPPLGIIQPASVSIFVLLFILISS